LIQEEKDSLCKSFDMTDLGLLHYCLGIEVWQQPNKIFISQTKYASKLLEKFRMEDCNPNKTPMEVNLKLSKDDESEVVNELLYRQLVGGLIYLTTTRPDITFVVGMLSRFLNCPRETHWNATKRVLRYIKGTSQFGIVLEKNDNFMLIRCRLGR
jgi:hypothetical protein